MMLASPVPWAPWLADVGRFIGTGWRHAAAVPCNGRCRDLIFT